ncbi:MAG: metallophosphoesterase [Spirochaetales bacterium]|nr:metallophosphoesterase [Spirochaetales bacterium]
MWGLIVGTGLAIGVLLVLYLVTRIHRFSFVRRLSERSRFLSWLVSLLAVSSLALFLLFNVTTFLIVVLHAALGFLFCDIAFLIYRKVSGKKTGYDLQNWLAIAITVIYLAIGWVTAHNIAITHYSVKTDKDIGGSLRIVGISDSHLGITLDGEAFARQMKRIQDLEPDIVVLIGDFVDDDSSREDMVRACSALGELKTKYGVYYVYGNHDDGYFRYRDFSKMELRRNLTDNGVVILEDQRVPVDGLFYIIGRKDRSYSGRADMERLTNGMDRKLFSIVLDHQPNDYMSEAASGVDLVLSGHTHGGHIFPAGIIGLIIGANDRVYGSEVRENTTFIVTSGISGWAIPFKTLCFSEILVVDVSQ